MKNILILGTGAYASALSVNLYSNFKKVYMFGIDQQEIEDINQNRRNSKYFQESFFEKNIEATNDYEKIINDVDFILIAIPSFAIENTVSKIILKLNKPVYWINASKGINSDKSFDEDILIKIVPDKLNKGIYKLIGGTFAQEMITNKPSKLTLTSKLNPKNDEILKTFNSSSLFTEWSDNYEAINFFSVFKNIYSILQGVLEGMGYEKNTQTFFIVDSLKELVSIIESKTNSKVNINDLLLSGTLGDFILTGTSNKSRNYSFGFEFAKNGFKNIDQNQTLEGLNSLKKISQNFQEELKNYSIIYFLNSIIIKNKDINDEFKILIDNIKTK